MVLQGDSLADKLCINMACNVLSHCGPAASNKGFLTSSLTDCAILDRIIFLTLCYRTFLFFSAQGLNDCSQKGQPSNYLMRTVGSL